ncbi:FAD-dependent oxidoreductase [Chloroflexota bacterium]
MVRKVDMVVVGGGPAGFGAAVAAARNGAETVLIERYGFLGGMLTAGLIVWLPIDKLAPLSEAGESKPLQGGIIQELVKRLVAEGGAINPSVSYKTAVGFETHLPTDYEICKVILQHMAEESGVNILLHSLVVDVIKEENEIKGVITESKSGRQAILAKLVIDASGDGDVAAAAGAEYDKSDTPLMMSLVGAMANVETEVAIKYTRMEGEEEFKKLVAQARKNKDLDISETKVLPGTKAYAVKPPVMNDPAKLSISWQRRKETAGWLNSIKGDCTNVSDLTRVELAARRNILNIVKFFRKYVPGYEHAYLAYTATQVGLRESRRVLGEYVLTYEGDIIKGRNHPDVIVKSRDGHTRNIIEYARAPIFHIPYRCIVPKSIDSLLVAGRCISVDHNAATRLSPRDECTCMCLGEAAGTAAALCVKEKTKPRNIDIKILQAMLTNQGANLT